MTNAKGQKRATPRDRGTQPEGVRLCACGCGTPVNRTWAPGHDAKFESVYRKVERGELGPSALNRFDPEIVAARARRAAGTTRRGKVRRETRETKIEVEVDLDGAGRTDIATGVGMLDHLLEQVGRHGLIDITLKGEGDLATGPHHTVEDAALGLGRAINEALADRVGIVRMADALVPLDDALAQVAVDLSGRGYASLDLSWAGERIGDLPTDLVGHILWTLASEARMNLHARTLSGANDHHKAEALFKALGRALGAASRIEPRRAGEVPSTKETLG